MNTQPQITLVEDPHELRTLRNRLATQEIVFVDTEFHAENRYFPKLMLLQIASVDGDVWLVDPLKINPEPLGAAMRKMTIVCHSGTEDVKLLYRALGLIPEKYFDVQVAAGILGLHYPMNLETLAKNFTDEQISKGESLTDWSQRPLKENQIEYATQDSRILIAIYQKQCVLLREQQKEEWAWAASEELLSNALKPKYAGLDWLEWNVAGSLDLPTQRVLTRLLTWREELAERKNKPPKYLLPRSSALYLAKRRPDCLSQIQNRRINRHFLKKYGRDVIRVIRDGVDDTDTFTLLSEQEKVIVSLLRSWALILSEEMNINAQVLLPNPIAKAIAKDGKIGLRGWRTKLFGDRLLMFLHGREYISFHQGQPVIQRR